MVEHDAVNHPKHYTQGKIECIEITEQLSFCLGNAVKYCWRWQDKNGKEDLKKAIWFLEREQSRRKAMNENRRYHEENQVKRTCIIFQSCWQDIPRIVRSVLAGGACGTLYVSIEDVKVLINERNNHPST